VSYCTIVGDFKSRLYKHFHKLSYEHTCIPRLRIRNVLTNFKWFWITPKILPKNREIYNKTGRKVEVRPIRYKWCYSPFLEAESWMSKCVNKPKAHLVSSSLPSYESCRMTKNSWDGRVKFCRGTKIGLPEEKTKHRRNKPDTTYVNFQADEICEKKRRFDKIYRELSWEFFAFCSADRVNSLIKSRVTLIVLVWSGYEKLSCKLLSSFNRDWTFSSGLNSWPAR
jgi:hypothetical protein